MSKKQKQIEINNPQELEANIFSGITMSQNAEEIYKFLTSDSCVIGSTILSHLGDTGLKKYIENYCNKIHIYHTIQAIRKGCLIEPTNRKQCFIYNEEVGESFTVKKETVTSFFAHKNLWLKHFYHIPCNYVPNTPPGFSETKNSFNKWYKPPFWREDGIYPNDPIPPQYEKFFRHFIANHEPSYKFLLDWIAMSLKDRNITYLTLISSSGAGKGTLFQILAQLHGKGRVEKDERGNAVERSFNTIDSRFNSLFEDRTLVSLNELNKATPAQIDFLKNFNSEQFEVEGKGVDSKIMENHFSVMISSNNIDCLQLQPKDRRFSILQVTDARLETVFGIDEIPNLYKNMDELRKLYNFFMNHEFDMKNKTEPFRAEKAALIAEASLEPWEQSFLDYVAHVYAGKTIPITKLTEIVREASNTKVSPAKKQLDSLAARYTGIFTIEKTHKYELEYYPVNWDHTQEPPRVYCAVFLPKKDQKVYDIKPRE